MKLHRRTVENRRNRLIAVSMTSRVVPSGLWNPSNFEADRMPSANQVEKVGSAHKSTCTPTSKTRSGGR